MVAHVFAAELMRALGIEPRGVVSLTIHLAPGEFPAVTVRKLLDRQDADNTTRVLRSLSFRAVPEPAKA